VVLAILLTGCALMSKMPWEMNLSEENKATKETMPSRKGAMPWEMGLVDKNKDSVTDIYAKEREQLKSDEGMVLESYRDSKGILTGGIGRNLEDKGLADKFPEGTKVPQNVSDEWFKEDFGVAVDDAEWFIGDTVVPDEVRSVVANMAFNLGRTSLGKFDKMQKAMQEGDWNTMAEEMRKSEWFKEVPNRADRLIKRIELLGS
jgi:lysozyme